MERLSGGARHDTDTDVMRLLAAFFVMVIHVPHPDSAFSVLYHSLARFSIPVFCMISGYYLADRETGVEKLLGRCLGLFLRMVAWSGIYYAYELAVGARSFEGLWALGTYLLTMPVHLWYLYAAIALYLFTPLLSAFARTATRQAYRYILVLTFFFGSLVTLALRTPYFPVLAAMVEKMKMDPTLAFVFCYLWAGYYKRFGLSQRARRVLYACALVGAAAPVVTLFCLGERSAEINVLLYSFFSPNALALGMAVFAGIKELWRSHPALGERAGAPLQKAASCTLGVYLLHPLVLELIAPFLRGPLGRLWPWLSIPAWVTVLYVLTLLAVLVLEKIPGFRKLVTL